MIKICIFILLLFILLFVFIKWKRGDIIKNIYFHQPYMNIKIQIVFLIKEYMKKIT